MSDNEFEPLILNDDVGETFPLIAGGVEEGTFEIGLVLGGTVSSACYTAGVLDFLVEALDAWMEAKQDEDPAAPPHKVKIRFVAGTSGGGISAAPFAQAMQYEFPHAGSASDEGTRASNPFYQTWVNRIRLRDMLDTDDPAAASLAASIHSTRMIEGAAGEVIALKGRIAAFGGTI